MQRQIFNNEEIAIIQRAAQLTSKANIAAGNANAPNEFRVINFTLEYGVARVIGDPYELNFPFRSVSILSSTHPDLVIKMRPYTRDESQGDIELRPKDSLSFGLPISRAYVYWDSQALTGGSTNPQRLTVLFSMSSDLRLGSFAAPLNGFKTNIFKNFTVAPSTVAAAAATPLTMSGATFDQNHLLQWNGTDTLYLGGSGVADTGPTKGFAVAPGDSFRWTNSGILYAYSTLGGEVVIIREF